MTGGRCSHDQARQTLAGARHHRAEGVCDNGRAVARVLPIGVVRSAIVVTLLVGALVWLGP
jgi:hypothetical protein